jgi:hypothetical protein
MVDRLPSRGTRNKRYRLTRLYKQQGGVCIYCKEPVWLLWKEDNIYERNEERGKPTKIATTEHKYPKTSFFGSDKVSNLACSCFKCNQDKRNFSHFTYKLMLASPKLYNIIIRLYYQKAWYKQYLGKQGRNIYEKIRNYLPL